LEKKLVEKQALSFGGFGFFGALKKYVLFVNQ